MLKKIVDPHGNSLVHIVTRAKGNVVAYEDPPPKTGGPGRPRLYGTKLKLMHLFTHRTDQFVPTAIELYGEIKNMAVLCLDLTWKPIREKARFVLVTGEEEHFILICSDLTLSPQDIITAYSYRFKIEVNFKVMKHLIGAFFYHFWTRIWPHIGKRTQSDLSHLTDLTRNMIKQTTNAIEAFVNFGCIATGILQILSLRFHQSIWTRYTGWLRTFSSTIPSEEVVRSLVQEDFFHNFRTFSNTAIYRIITSKRRKANDLDIPLRA